MPKPGEPVKVYLPGESPWVTCVQFEPNGNLLLGRLDNYPFSNDLHPYKYGDLITFHLVDYGFAKCWEPSPRRKLDSTLKVVHESTTDSPTP